MAKKETQSYKLYKLFKNKRNRRGVTVEQMATATGLKPAYMGSYLNELKRVYGAQISYDTTNKRYTLGKGKLQIPPQGLAGRRPQIIKADRVRPRRTHRQDQVATQ